MWHQRQRMEDMSTSQGLSRIAYDHQQLGDRHGPNFLSEASKETNLPDLNFELLTSRTMRK